MPNWVTNNVRINADETLLAKIREEVKGTPYSNGEDREFDFNTIAPIPTELVGTTSPTRIISQEEYDKQEERIAKGDLTEGEKSWGVSRGITQEMHDDFIKRFGFADWYGWQKNNWGTKWNASDVNWIDDDLVSFNTAWSTPFDLLVKLSEKYPQATFEVEYADEDFGYNVGRYVLQNGEEIDTEIPEGGTREALELAITIQYGDVSEYYFEDVFEDLYDDEITNYVENMIGIAYDNDIVPFEDCNWHELVLERFKEKALADEKFELVATIQKELDKVEK